MKRFLWWALEAFVLSWSAAKPRDEAPGRWLILGYGAIGDVIFFLPVIEGLRRRYPDAHITFLANKSPIIAELVPLTGLVNEFEVLEGYWETLPRLKTLWRLRRRKYDGVILTLSSPAHFFGPLIARIPIRVGHCTELSAPESLGFWAALKWKLRRGLVTGEWTRRRLLTHVAWNTKVVEHAARRNWRLAETLGLAPQAAPPRPQLPISEPARQFALKTLGAPGKRKWVGVHLGAAQNPYHKIWPAERFGQVLARLNRAAADVVFLGGPEEATSVVLACKTAGFSPLSLAGKCALSETFAVIARCELFVSNDTGLAKAAMALGVPTATIWGPTDVAELGALWEAEKHLDLRSGISCSPCVRYGMPQARRAVDYTDCGHHDCLGAFGASSVLAALRAKWPEYWLA